MLPDAEECFPLDRMERLNWLLLAAMTVAGFFIASFTFGASLFVGGVIANSSFMLLKKDIIKVLSGPLQAAKGRFLLKYYIRLTFLALIIFCLVRYGSVHLIGLMFGLSTVVISIGIMAAAAARKVALTVKEAP